MIKILVQFRLEGRVLEQQNSHQAEQLLHAFLTAWNKQDIVLASSYFTDDCIFEPSVGQLPQGHRFVGKQNFIAAARRMFADVPDAHWRCVSHFASEAHMVLEFVITGTYPDGNSLQVHGCDIFTLRDGLLCRKNSYRKCAPRLIAGVPQAI
jgi:ketosteroid isomerase-like protein